MNIFMRSERKRARERERGRKSLKVKWHFGKKRVKETKFLQQKKKIK
jgi:hypothetical protein